MIIPEEFDVHQYRAGSWFFWRNRFKKRPGLTPEAMKKAIEEKAAQSVKGYADDWIDRRVKAINKKRDPLDLDKYSVHWHLGGPENVPYRMTRAKYIRRRMIYPGVGAVIALGAGGAYLLHKNRDKIKKEAKDIGSTFNAQFTGKQPFITYKMSPERRAKIAKVMHEFKAGTLRSSSGERVTNRKQAIAIALSEARNLSLVQGSKTYGMMDEFLKVMGGLGKGARWTGNKAWNAADRTWRSSPAFWVRKSIRKHPGFAAGVGIGGYGLWAYNRPRRTTPDV